LEELRSKSAEDEINFFERHSMISNPDMWLLHGCRCTFHAPAKVKDLEKWNIAAGSNK
jgi:hypothetical protein